MTPARRHKGGRGGSGWAYITSIIPEGRIILAGLLLSLPFDGMGGRLNLSENFGHQSIFTQWQLAYPECAVEQRVSQHCASPRFTIIASTRCPAESRVIGATPPSPSTSCCDVRVHEHSDSRTLPLHWKWKMCEAAQSSQLFGAVGVYR